MTTAAEKKAAAAAEAEHAWPHDVFIGEGVESTHIDGVEYTVDPATGRVVN